MTCFYHKADYSKLLPCACRAPTSAGTDKPMTTADQKRLKAIWELTWPQLAMMTCQFVIGITDAWAGGQIGPEAQATIGFITQFQMVFMALAMAASGGAVASVSQSLGAGRTLRARRYVALTVCTCVGAGMLIALASGVFRVPLLELAHTPQAMFSLATLFLTIYLWSLPGQYAMSIGAAVFRAAKSVKIPLIPAVAACVINVFGDLAFGLGWWGFPAYGAAGVAWSTFVSVNGAGLVMIILLLRARLLTRQGIPSWRWVRKGAPYLLKVAAPALGTSLLWQVGYMVLLMLTATLPHGEVAALAGLTAGLRVEALLFLPPVAFNMTAAVLVGHALGRGDRAEARRILFQMVTLACSVMSVAGACMWPWRAAIAAELTTDPAVRAEIVSYLTYNILCIPFTSASVVTAGSLSGAGATIYPMLAYSISVWLVRLPVAWLFGHILWQSADGIYLSMLVSQAAQASTLVWAASRLDWMRFAMRGKTTC